MEKRKHAFLVKAQTDNRKHFKLVCEDAYLCDFFESWTLKLAKKRKFNTVKAYAEAVVGFCNYMFEVKAIKGALTDLVMHEVIDSYESYLAFASSSDIEIARQASLNLQTSPVGGSTISTHFAGLNNFLGEGEKLRATLLSMEQRGVPLHVSPSDVGIDLYTIEQSSHSTRSAMKNSSWLAGCKSGMVRTVKMKKLAPTVKPSTIIHSDDFGGDEKAFPIDKCMELLNNAKNLRDKLLWSLLAATGGRISEAQTLRKDDVVINVNMVNETPVITKEVSIIDPATRKDILVKYMSESDFNSLPHKGRASPDTFLIEPFATVFWQTLDEYTKSEAEKSKTRGVSFDHGFLLRKQTDGEPIIGSYQSLYDSFSNAAMKVTGHRYGFHSLRHMYGYYLKNFCPLPGGRFGMNLKSVQKYLGHQNISSTERYARDDAIKLSAAIGAMNMERNRLPHFSIKDAKIAYLESEIARLKSDSDTKLIGG